MFHEDTVNTTTYEIGGIMVLQSGCDEQDLSGEIVFRRRTDEITSIALSQIKIQQHDVHDTLRDDSERTLDGIRMSCKFEVGFCRQ